MAGEPSRGDGRVTTVTVTADALSDDLNYYRMSTLNGGSQANVKGAHLMVVV